MALSVRYVGPGIDPNALHWVKVAGASFAVLGFIFKEKVGAAVGNAIAIVFHVEAGIERQSDLSWPQILVVLGIIAVVLWYVLR